MRYEAVAAACGDLERASGRLEMIDRLARLFGETPNGLLPTVVLLCLGRIAPDFAGVDIGLAERLAARAVARAAGGSADEVLAAVREVGDLGLATERMLAGRPAVPGPIYRSRRCSTRCTRSPPRPGPVRRAASWT
jgi:DNA ligase 1